jgi:hypothetical protein
MPRGLLEYCMYVWLQSRSKDHEISGASSIRQFFHYSSRHSKFAIVGELACSVGNKNGNRKTDNLLQNMSIYKHDYDVFHVWGTRPSMTLRCSNHSSCTMQCMWGLHGPQAACSGPMPEVCWKPKAKNWHLDPHWIYLVSWHALYFSPTYPPPLPLPTLPPKTRGGVGILAPPPGPHLSSPSGSLTNWRTQECRRGSGFGTKDYGSTLEWVEILENIQSWKRRGRIVAFNRSLKRFFSWD